MQMFQIDPMSREPVYEQIIAQVERFVLTDVLPAGSQIPSVRGVSMMHSTLEMARTICTDMAPQKSTPARSTSETAQMPIFPARCVQSRRIACHRG